jgi:hypothetical protein
MKKSEIFVAQDTETKRLYTFNGAYKMAEFIGVNARTIYRNAKYTFTEKVYNGYVFAKSRHNEVKYRDRGTKINRFLGKQKGFVYK